MSIPVMTSHAAPAKAQSPGGTVGPAMSSGSAPGGAFAAVLQGRIDSREPSTATASTAPGRESEKHAVDGMDPIIVPALFMQAAQPMGQSATGLESGGFADSGSTETASMDLIGTDATVTDSTAIDLSATDPAVDELAAATAVSVHSSQDGVTIAESATLSAPATAPASATATASPRSDDAGESVGVPPVHPLPIAAALTAPATSAALPPTIASAAGMAVTASDGSMTRTGDRVGGTTRTGASAPSSSALGAAGAATTASMNTARASDGENATGPAPLMSLPSSPTPAGVDAAAVAAAAATSAAAATATASAAAATASASPATAAPSDAATDVIAATTSALSSTGGEPVAEVTPAAAQSTLPVGQPVPVHPAAPTAPAAPAPSVVSAQPVPMATQIAAPLFTLVGAKPGEHVLTINVTPDNLGPVTVRAHVSVDSVRVELFAPTDAGRDALRAILPDLRRDLAGSGLNANLDLSSQNHASDSEAPVPDALRERRAAGGDGAADLPTENARPRSFGSSSTLDVLA
jgi:flagellar hook-length control protein FliK